MIGWTKLSHAVVARNQCPSYCWPRFGASFALPRVDDKNNHMKRTRLIIVIWFVLTGSFAFAQDGKTEIGVFAGGYFNSGFQSFKVLNPTTGAQVGTFKPVSEANSGIFGLRSSYRFVPQLEAEGTFSFSPAGRIQNFLGGIPTSIVQVQPTAPVLIAISAPVLRDGNVYLYSGTLLTYLNRQGTWRPFFTAGAGGITRTAKIEFVRNTVMPVPVGTPVFAVFSPTIVPATTRTDMTLVLGAGFKKYLPHGLGARLDFRDHINKFDQSTVNNMELSLGLFTRF